MWRKLWSASGLVCPIVKAAMEYLRTDHRAGPSTDTRNTSARALQRLACVLTLALTCACAGPDTQGDWSIGIYRGDSPLTLGPPSDVVNPVLRARDITDVQAQYVADPFMLRAGPLWYLCCEVLQRSRDQQERADLDVRTDCASRIIPSFLSLCLRMAGRLLHDPGVARILIREAVYRLGVAVRLAL
jgi:hypothetical protein